MVPFITPLRQHVVLRIAPYAMVYLYRGIPYHACVYMQYMLLRTMYLEGTHCGYPPYPYLLSTSPYDQSYRPYPYKSSTQAHHTVGTGTASSVPGTVACNTTVRSTSGTAMQCMVCPLQSSYGVYTYPWIHGYDIQCTYSCHTLPLQYGATLYTVVPHTVCQYQRMVLLLCSGSTHMQCYHSQCEYPQVIEVSPIWRSPSGIAYTHVHPTAVSLCLVQYCSTSAMQQCGTGVVL